MARVRRLRQRRRRSTGPELSGLALATPVVAENTPAGTMIGAILGRTPGSALSLIDDAGGRFALSGANLVTGAVATDHEAADRHVITLRETLAGYGNSPRDSLLTVAVTHVIESGAHYLTSDGGERLTDDGFNPLILEAA